MCVYVYVCSRLLLCFVITVHYVVLPSRQLDVRLLEKMKLNCQVFKEEISMVHLNRQVAHLQNALQESYIKVLYQIKITSTFHGLALL